MASAAIEYFYWVITFRFESFDIPRNASQMPTCYSTTAYLGICYDIDGDALLIDS